MAKKKFNKYIEEKSKPLIQATLKKAKRDFYKCALRTNNILYKEVTAMYDTLIKQFYQYHTSSYVRHWEFVPGTEEGQNLYFGKNFKKDNHYRISPLLIVEFSGNEMEGGYQYHTPDEVLQYVMNGIRFATGQGYIMMAETDFHYIGRCFAYQGDTIQGAFDMLHKKWKDISSDVFYSMWDDYVKQWKEKE